MKAKKPLHSYGRPQIGCYLDHACRNATGHNLATLRLAIAYGFPADRDTLALMDRQEKGALLEDDSDMAAWCADEAIEWLNGQEERPFLYWDNDGEAGAFGLWASVEGAKEDCGFVSTRGHECPDHDFEGDWLRISDHGNATLYARAAGKDVEIWSAF